MYLSWRQRRLLVALAELPDDAAGLPGARMSAYERQSCNSLVRRGLATGTGRFTSGGRYRITPEGRTVHGEFLAQMNAEATKAEPGD